MTTATTLGPRMRQVLGFLRLYPGSTATAVGLFTDRGNQMTRDRALAVLRRLEQRGLARREVRHGVTRWYAVR